MRSVVNSLQHAAWYRRLQAALLARANRLYEPHIRRRKRELLGSLRGTVVEIGPGTGANLPYYDRSIRWIGIEPNAFAHEYLRREAARQLLEAELHEGRAERMPLADDSADAVVSTLVLCSVDDVPAVLREVRRVLRSSGHFVFVEHVAAPSGTWNKRLQKAIRPAWGVVADGCRPDRKTWEDIETAGFREVEMEHFRLPLPIVGPHIAGTARK